MKNSALVLFVFCFFFSIKNFAQTDTAFWFAAPEISKDPSFPTGPLDRPVLLRISAFGTASTVTVTQPARPAFVPIAVNVSANSSVTVDLTTYLDSIENQVPDVVHNFGLKISATYPVEVYYEENSQANPELFTLKGRNALGIDFFIPSQTLLPNVSQYSPLPYSSFDLVATENNTTVTITPAKNIVGHTAGTTYTKVLHKGQTYSAKATSQAANQHLDGSWVTADKPIAITIKDDLLTAGAVFENAHDLGGDQIVPLNKLGTEYIPVRGRLRFPYDKIFVLATQNNTTVRQDGNLIATINAGATQMLGMTANATYIQTNNPVYVLQLTGHGGECGLDVLPPVECTGSSQVAYTRSTSDSLFLMLLVKNGGQGNFLFNGNTGIVNAASFFPVPGTGNQWYSAFLIIPTPTLPLNGTAIVENTSHLFHMGVINGTTGQGARFGYFSDFNSFYVQANSNSPLCPGSQLQLTADSVQGAVYSWSGPGGFSSSLRNTVRNNITIADTGTYTLTVSRNGCVSTATVKVLLQTGAVAPFNLGNDTSYCGSFSRILSTGNVNTVWSTGATGSQITVNTLGTYWATVNTSCGNASDTIVISQGNLSLTLSVIGTSCGFNNGLVTANVANGQAPFIYQWSNGGTNAAITNLAPGNYQVTVSDNSGCSSTSSAVVNPSGTGSVIITSNGSPLICSHDSVQICAPSGYNQYLWNTGQTGQCIYAKLAGNYYVTITDAGNCTVSSNHLAVNVYPLPPVSISVNGDTLMGYNAVTYQWYFNGSPISGATFPIFIANQPGNYSLLVTDSNGCIAISNPISVVSIDGFNHEIGIIVYPNPSLDGNWQLVVDDELLGSKIQVIDVNGKFVFESEIKKRKSEIKPDVGIMSGIYWLRIQKQQRNYVAKLFKQ